MKHLDEYRDLDASRRIVERIRRTATRRWTLMEVCGGQTRALLRYGIDEAVGEAVELIHGPGCPVCVTPVEAIDLAVRLALRPGTTVASFGDMLRVPGSRTSLLDARTGGGDVRVVPSPLDAVELARRDPGREVVFFAVGFETTVPATALAVLQAARLGLGNFSVLAAHVRVLPAMESIAAAEDSRVQGFLAAGHVCTVIGLEGHEAFAARHRLPVVAAGFEPLDLLDAILECTTLLESGSFAATNRYARSVTRAGNEAARALIERVFEPADRPWRGLGIVENGGLVLRREFATFDAERQFPRPDDELPILLDDESRGSDECRSGDVLTGRIRPTECPSFGTRCTPSAPLGAPMVSSEGACAAYYAHRGAASAFGSCPVAR